MALSVAAGVAGLIAGTKQTEKQGRIYAETVNRIRSESMKKES